jgi:hypothetical protein
MINEEFHFELLRQCIDSPGIYGVRRITDTFLLNAAALALPICHIAFFIEPSK